MRVLAALALAGFLLGPVTEASAEMPQASATLARDIGGIELGMSIDEVRGRMTLEHVAFETFSGRHDGIQFDLGFTPGGRVFRIESRQHLGRFQPDAAFTKSLSAKLVSKYGPPAFMHLPDGPASWSLVEPVSDASGETRPFNVMWANAMLSNDERGVSLLLTMLDFRILWEDQARQNSGPAREAAQRIQF